MEQFRVILNYIVKGIILVFFLGISQCHPVNQAVIVYVSVDQNYAQPVIQKFEKRTGIKVLPVFDMEAAKTTGLVNRMIAEKNNPQADVFWSGEFVQTIALKEAGILSAYKSPQASQIQDRYKDTAGFWTGFSGRARVILVNTTKLVESQYPQSIIDLIESDLPPEEIGMARPLFGTTYTHAAALYAYWGQSDANAFFSMINSKGIQILDGNSSVRDFVASGKLSFGLTDTDDACKALKRGDPVKLIFPDQDSFGTLVVPNTVALVGGGPHPLEARMFIDYLLEMETLEDMIASGWCHVPLRETAIKPECIGDLGIKIMDIDLMDIYYSYRQNRDKLINTFLR